MDRRIVLVGLAIATLVMACIIVVFKPSNPLIATLMTMSVGAFLQPAYSVSVAHAYDHADPAEYVETSSGLLLAYGIGSILGPMSASLLMNVMGSEGLYAQVALVQVATILFVTGRLMTRKTPSRDEKTDFEYAATAQVGSVIAPDPLDTDDPLIIPPEEFPAYDTQAFDPAEPGVTEENVPGAGQDTDSPDAHR
ncbi:MFS transporter [Pannonibacter sp. Pt2-lr]